MPITGKKAVHFSAPAVINGSEIVQNFSLDQYLGKNYVVFFFYPKDFSGICPIELHDFQAKLAEFEKRNAVVIGCSTDTQESHMAWLRVAKDHGGIAGITYPLVSDSTKTISTNYGVLAGEYDYNENGELITDGPMIAYRGLFIIDKNGVVQHTTINHFTLTRSANEALRVLDSLQYFEQHGEVCPID